MFFDLDEGGLAIGVLGLEFYSCNRGFDFDTKDAGICGLRVNWPWCRAAVWLGPDHWVDFWHISVGALRVGNSWKSWDPVAYEPTERDLAEAQMELAISHLLDEITDD